MPDAAAVWGKIGFADDFAVSKDHEMMHVCIVGSIQIPEQVCQHVRGDTLAFWRDAGKWLLVRLVKGEFRFLWEKIHAAGAVGFSKNNACDQFCNCNLFFCHRGAPFFVEAVKVDVRVIVAVRKECVNKGEIWKKTQFSGFSGALNEKTQSIICE